MEPGRKVWGAAYEVEDSLWKDKGEGQLADRERSGMVGGYTTFHPLDGRIGDQEAWLQSGSPDLSIRALDSARKTPVAAIRKLSLAIVKYSREDDASRYNY